MHYLRTCSTTRTCTFMSTEAEEIPSYESTKVVFLALFIYSPKAKNFISSKKQLLPLYSTCRLRVRVPSKVRKYYLRRYFRTFVHYKGYVYSCTFEGTFESTFESTFVHSYIHDHTRTRTVVYEDTFESTSGSTGTLQYFRKYFRTLHSSPTT